MFFIPAISIALSLMDRAPVLDACELLARSDVEAALGAPVNERKPSTQTAGALLTSQCFFNTSSARAVSLTVTRSSGAAPSALTAREYWRRQFHSGEREGEDDRRPLPISDLGDEAYWTGNRFAGALYVLHGDAFLRISVGGIRDEEARIEASKTLARALLKRLNGGKKSELRTRN